MVCYYFVSKELVAPAPWRRAARPSSHVWWVLHLLSVVIRYDVGPHRCVDILHAGKGSNKILIAQVFFICCTT